MSTRTQAPKIGRPMKYASLFLKLDPDTLYSPASIAVFARHHGHVKGSRHDRNIIMIRIRSSAAYIQKHFTSACSDGILYLRGQRPFRAWLGKRWIDAVAYKKKHIRNRKLQKRRAKKKTSRLFGRRLK